MISTHILNLATGNPAGGVKVSLLVEKGGSWMNLDTGRTNSDGRYTFQAQESHGLHQIIFEVENIFSSDHQTAFYKNVPVVFQVDGSGRKYHIPLLISPFGYSTYRGS